ncbi:MAG: GntR family transcriptional regulator [Planctomycetia bacterium]|nr:GntR family transcriptional regulator [Planctomycetia bacterium]
MASTFWGMLIKNFIKDDLAARLRSGQQLPAKLTIDALAEHYNVSFTPVRTAVTELINEGLLEKQPNRRLAARVTRTVGRRATREWKLPEQPRDAFQIVASDLVRLSLKGEAVYLREEGTAEKYNMSRSAIRNILHRLAGEGVLDHVPRRGWRLRPFRQDDLQAFVEVREVLELKALDLVWPRLDSIELQRMLDANVLPGSSHDLPRVDETLHEYLIKYSGNAYICEFFERQGRYYRMLFEWEDHDRATAMETVRQHQAILTALLEKNWSAACKLLSHHILNNHPILSVIGSVGDGEN